MEYQKLAEFNCNEKDYKTAISMYKVCQLKNDKVRGGGVWTSPSPPEYTPGE